MWAITSAELEANLVNSNNSKIKTLKSERLDIYYCDDEDEINESSISFTKQELLDIANKMNDNEFLEFSCSSRWTN